MGCPLVLDPNMLAILNSVQKCTCAILGNVITISINQVLELIHAVDNDRFDHFD
jgi:hypothetical protein